MLKFMKINSYKLFTWFNVIFMFLIILATAYPVYYVIAASFSDPAALSIYNGPLLFPLQPMTTSAYKMVFANQQIANGFLNTAYLMVFGLSVNIILTVLGGYFLTIKGPMLKDFITFMIIFTMYFSGGMVPAYLNIKELGLLNSLWALILSGGITTSNLIIMKSAFAAIPDSLTESARLDGASYLQILIKIMISLSKATMAVMVLYYGVSRWNAWFNASIYLQDSDLYPLQLVMQNMFSMALQMAESTNAGSDEVLQVVELIKYALIVVTTAPIIVLYPFLQKYFVKGVMIGAIKG